MSLPTPKRYPPTNIPDMVITQQHPQPFPDQFIGKSQAKDWAQVPPHLLLHVQGWNKPTDTPVLCNFRQSRNSWVPTEAHTILINPITMLDEEKLAKVTFKTRLEMTQPETPSHFSGSATLKHILKNQIPRTIMPDTAKSTPPTTAAAHDILALKCTFPLTPHMIGDMPGTYTTWINPSVSLVQHTQWKVPIEYHDQIQSTLDKMITLSHCWSPNWPSRYLPSPTPGSHTAPSIYALTPETWTREIVWEQYKAPTFNKIFHCLSSAMTFSKLDANDNFWSVHLNKKSSYLTTFHTHKGSTNSCTCPLVWRCPRMSFGCAWTS